MTEDGVDEAATCRRPPGDGDDPAAVFTPSAIESSLLSWSPLSLVMCRLNASSVIKLRNDASVGFERYAG